MNLATTTSLRSAGAMLTVGLLLSSTTASALTITATAPPSVPALPGHTLEDFEDVNLIAGLQVELRATSNSAVFGPSSTLGAFSLNAGKSPDFDDWDGVNSLWNQINNASDDANVIFHFAQTDITSVGFGLAGVDIEQHQVVITDQNDIIISQLLNTALFPGFTTNPSPARDFYLQITHDTGIKSVELRVPGPLDAFSLDALQFGQVVPEPSAAMLGCCILCSIAIARRR